MGALGNTLHRHTVVPLEARKSYAFGMRLQKKADSSPIDLTGAQLRLVLAKQPYAGGTVLVDRDATVLDAPLGLVQFELQAADLNLAAGEYPFAVTLVSALGFSTLLMKGSFDVQDNADVEIAGTYAGINPSTNLAVYLDEGDLVTIEVNQVDGMYTIVEARLAEAQAASNDAQAAAAAALVSETNADTSETSAFGSAQTATTKAAEASTSATTATTKAAEASTSATSALASKNSANASETSATASAAAALASKNAAATSETNADASKVSALASKNAAATSETNAGTSAATATTKANEASTSATSALASKNSANASETAALASKNAAATSETNASSSAASALASKNAAATSETNAAASATTATTKAAEASTSADDAAASAAQASAVATGELDPNVAGLINTAGSASRAAVDGRIGVVAPAGHTHPSTDVTGTKTSAYISDFLEAVQDAIAATLTSGTQVSLTYNDAAGTLQVSATGADAETMRDTIGAALVGVGNIAVTVNDAADTITISTTATVNSTDAALRDRSTHTGTDNNATLAGTTTVGTANTDIIKTRAVGLGTDTRSTTQTYTGGKLTQVLEKDGATTVKTTTLAYTGENLTTVTEVAGGVTVTTTLTYTGTDLTGTTRSVA